MSYMVMECHTSYAVVLDREGRFLKVANLHYTPGQRVTDVVPMQVPEQKHSRRWVYALSAVAACLVLLLTSAFILFQMPYASVYLSINPEVRIDVNRTDRVVGLEGVNADGLDLIQGYDYKNKDLDLVMDELVDLAIQKEYLHPGGQINLSLDAKDQSWVSHHSSTLQQQLDTYLDNKITVDILVQIGVPAHDGESDYSQSDYLPVETTQAAPSHDDHTDYGHSHYSHTDYGNTQYEPTSPYEEATSPYEAPESDYDDPETDYEAPESDYDDPDTDYDD